VRILRRGVELLEVGGRIVYSTCSFNPVEDEAVVSTILTQMNGNKSTNCYFLLLSSSYSNVCEPCIFILLSLLLKLCFDVGTMELVDVSDRLPGLLRENGVSSWRVRLLNSCRV